MRTSIGISVAAAMFAAGCSGGDPASTTPDAAAPRPGVAQRVVYADHDDGFGELWLPAAGGGGVALDAPVVVLIHGGFWRDGFFLDLMTPLVPSLLARGVAVWNLEYRRVGAGGGYPATFDDIAAGIDHLARLGPGYDGVLDVDNVAVVGHSAGGHLAVWAASRSALPADVPGGDPVVVPALAVAQAGVLDLAGCARARVGGSACPDLIGASPDDAPERYAQTSPIELVPIDVRVVAVHGDGDRIVPVVQSETYVERAVAAGMDARVEVVAGADHFSNLDPDHPAWTAVLDAVDYWSPTGD